MAPKTTSAVLKQEESRTPAAPSKAHDNNVVRLPSAIPDYEVKAIETADRYGWTGKHREQFIAQSIKLAEALEKAVNPASGKLPPMQHQWTQMQAQQQSGGLLFTNPSQK